MKVISRLAQSGAEFIPVDKGDDHSCGNTFDVVDTRCGYPQRYAQKIANVSTPFRWQKDEVLEYHKARQLDIVERWERESCFSLHDKKITLMLLLELARIRGVAICSEMGYDEPIRKSVKDSWSSLIEQAHSFLSDNDTDLHCRLVEALEIISSLGIWYCTMNTSLPLRRFLVHIPDDNGEIHQYIVSGLVNFSYSSYIIDVRKEAQERVLGNIKLFQQKLGSDSLFLPHLLVSPSPRNPEG